MTNEQKIEHLASLVDDAIENIKSYLMGEYDPMEARDDMMRTMKRLQRGLEHIN